MPESLQEIDRLLRRPEVIPQSTEDFRQTTPKRELPCTHQQYNEFFCFLLSCHANVPTDGCLNSYML